MDWIYCWHQQAGGKYNPCSKCGRRDDRTKKIPGGQTKKFYCQDCWRAEVQHHEGPASVCCCPLCGAPAWSPDASKLLLKDVVRRLNEVDPTDVEGVLGLPKKASKEQFRKQYHKLSLLLHPDKRAPSDELRAGGRNACESAYQILRTVWERIENKPKMQYEDAACAPGPVRASEAPSRAPPGPPSEPHPSTASSSSPAPCGAASSGGPRRVPPMPPSKSSPRLGSLCNPLPPPEEVDVCETLLVD